MARASHDCVDFAHGLRDEQGWWNTFVQALRKVGHNRRADPEMLLLARRTMLR